ncbi:MAG: hypothetical protein HW386_1196 [Gammaproteobacteria bacterium]|nr:hypothetical protein [Gammaproteobacteria bacterium]
MADTNNAMCDKWRKRSDQRIDTRNLQICDSLKFLPGHALFVALCLLCFALAAQADEVILHSGDVLRGTVKQQSEERVVLEHPDLGEIVIPAARIARVTITKPAAPSVSGKVETVTAQATPTIVDEHRQGQWLFDHLARWNTGVSIGGSSTNDDDGMDLDLNTRVKASERLPSRETEFDLSYIVGASEGVIDDNNMNVMLERGWLKLDTPWLYAGRVRYEFDQFRSWDHRFTGYFGTGYRIVNSDTLRFAPFLGIGGRKETGSLEEISTPEGTLGAILRWTPGEQQELYFESLWHPALTESQHRVVTRISWRRPLAIRKGVSFVTNLEHEYDTSPDPGFPEQEWTWTWSLQWAF